MIQDAETDEKPHMRLMRNPLLMPAIVALIVFSVQSAWIPHRMDRLQFTGDEPHYFLTTESLVYDGDAEESNNYAESDLEPHPTNSVRDGVYSKHGIGLPLLLMAPYAIGGPTLSLVFMAAIGALVAANIAMLAHMFCSSRLMAGALGVAFGLSSPLGTFGLLIFPEMPAALCVVYVTRRLLEKQNTTLQWGVMGAALAALPWLHQRFIFIVLALVIVIFWRHRESMTRRNVIAGLVFPVIAATALFGWWMYLYGRPFPASDDHAGFSPFPDFLLNASGLLIDQQWGVLIYSPLLILAMATILPFARSLPKIAATFAIIAVPYVTFIALFSQWYGGLSSPGRFLNALIPLAAVPVAWWLNRLPQRLAWGMLGLVALPSMAIMALMLIEPHRLNSYPGGTALLVYAFEVRLGLPFTNWLPLFIGEFAWSTSRLVVASLVALAGMILLTLIAWWMAYRVGSDRTTDQFTSP